ncbi:MAG: peptidylprolyl isomerase [Tannerellaceae bacterium]|nr:peptidylprolyl isomerase [Tannerellaceae bacterium]
MKPLLFLFTALFILQACGTKPLNPDKPVYVTIGTTMGDVTVLLYDDTPLHKENFIRLCQSGEQVGVLFHRVIQDFVVQGGDPESKAHEPGARYGSGNGGYTVPAEIVPHYFNKRGALIDAKRADDVNPERTSAGTQFCFVQGYVHDDAELDEKEMRINQIRRNWLYHKFTKQLVEEEPELANESRQAELENRVLVMIEDTLDLLGPLVIPAEHREVYKTIGGVPHLDHSVTIFGEVVDGLDVVERISKVETDAYDRPLTDVIVRSTRVFQK